MSKDSSKKLDEINTENESLRSNLQIMEAQHIEYLINQFLEYHTFNDYNPNLIKCRESLVSNLNLLRALWEIQGKEYGITTFVKFLSQKIWKWI